jgi:ribonuclease G
MKQIIINSEEMQTRVAVVCDGVLHDFFMERKDSDRLVGSIFKGRIKNLEPSLQAAFVDIGRGKNAFLHYWDMLPASQEMLEGEEENDIPEEEFQPRKPVAPAPVKVPEGNGFFARLCRLFRRTPEEPAQETAPQPTAPARQAAPQRRRKKGNAPKKPSYTVEDIPNIFKEEQEILVQVTKGPISTKGARVTTNLSIPGRYLVLLPNSTHIGVSKRVEEKPERDRLRQMMRTLHIPRNMGAICRTVGAGMKPEQFQRDLDILLDSWSNGQNQKRRAPYCVYQEPDLAERTLRDCLTEDVDEIITDSKEVYERANELMQRYNMQGIVKIRLYDNPTPIFNKYNLTKQIDGIFSRKVNLPSGGYLVIDQTEALIAIDVNTGKNRTGKDQPETILATNMEAVKEIARQLRLRNVGGLVVLDLIDMRSKKDQMTVYKTLKELMSEDRAKTKVYPISPLGLLEMTRQREDESFESAIFDDCPYCKGRGLIKSATSMSVEIQRRLNEICAKRKLRNLTVCAHPRIIERLKNEDRQLFTDIEVTNRADITFKADNLMHIEEYKIIDNNSGQAL